MRQSFLTLLTLSILFSGCELASGIFKAGFWSGILIVAAIVGIIIYFVSRAGKK